MTDRIVTITTSGDTLYVEAPYHAEFVRDAKLRCAGRWDGTRKAWQFRAADRAAVEALCVECYGTDGSTPVELVDLLVTLGGEGHDSDVPRIECAYTGLTLASRAGRDVPVRLAAGVTLERGEPFGAIGGSMKHPSISRSNAPRVLRVRNVARAIAERAVADHADTYAIAEIAPSGAAGAPVDPHAVLREERARLVARLAEIDAALAPVAP